ncbi:M48 family metallopeptidase [Bradyrhizobium sp.]|uniref:M48 family metallopeptidase n=1 Tax=Bradyrhizobium sp. TaxID=376 RepID=UPI001DC33568|nr:M48 family metallopeptidase [Bradyrhizobium sp.]MBI5323086.1 M48 family metallopeptidase [Bradyrhizobium sp.]
MNATGSESVIYFDGTSSRRHAATLAFADALEIAVDGEIRARWPFADIRRADSAPGTLRVSCQTAPALARLEIRDAALAAELTSRTADLDEHHLGRRGVAKIVGWSLAAAVSIVVVVLYGVPLAADRLAPLVPESFERRFGDVAEKQVKFVFGEKVCDSSPAGQAAFDKLVTTLRNAAGLDDSVQSAVLSSEIPNALALPGGKIIMFDSLIAKAHNPDEIAGVIAHELGHLRHRDNMRGLIYNGGTSFLIGLLFGDITGSSAVIFASRTLVTSSHSREAETAADTFSIDVMKKLGRPPKAMGELMLRVTGKEGGKGLTIISTHPLSEDRLARMSREDQTPKGPPLLTDAEWRALKGICGKGKV